MKKFIAIIMSIVMVLKMPIYLLADENTTITQDSKDKSGNINIDYYADVTYNVTIPASVTFTDTEKTVERGLQVSNVVLNEGSSLKVDVKSLNGFKMVYNEGFIDYYLKINYATITEKNDFNILTVKAGESSGWVILEFITELNKANAKYTGKYTDILTFTVSID